ncbi:hypothetical protein BDN72DRAFT_838508 [Pluteus cervinus]|uniref:Uncharacterized protein n=1 Tax=Pluteus cervinus TaxID=181527 RepID=A0ACD3AZR9_9AGAR|nr:hypothetical protein BDN72DRAFT_838508 [Pluteus cervinus]
MSTIYYHIQDTNFDKIKSFENTLQRLVKMTTECAYFIASYKQKAFARRTLEGAILGVDGIIKDFEERFAQLRIEFLMGSTLQSTHTVLLVLNKVRNIETLLHLQPLPLIKNTGWMRIRTNLTSQQEEIFDGLTIWAQTPDKRVVSVFVGDSRDEASLIAHKLCERFHGQERLGSAVFFPEATGDTELSCECLISTIARELAALHPTFAESIADVLAKSPSLALSSTHLNRQFEDLLIHPLQSLTMIGPALIVLDGLDRCSDQLTFMETLTAPHILGRIPHNIRFLLAVGPQPQPLYPLLCGAGSSLRIWRTGGEMQSHAIMSAVWRYISKDYRGSQLLDRLEDLDTKMTHVHSHVELEIPPGPYPTITPAFLLSEIRRVVLVTKGRHASFLEPLLDQAQQCIPPELMPHFESYSCFVSIQASKRNRPFHTLFLELKDDVDPEIAFWSQEIADTHHLEGIPSEILKSLPNETSNYRTALPFLALRYLNMTLTPNICQFEEVTKLNKDIKDLDRRLRTHVPTTLRLLSGCWLEWIAPYLQTPQEDGCRAILSELRTFLSSHLLSWIELISLLGCPDDGLKQLQLLEPVLSQMMKGMSADTDDIGFIHSAISDSIRFMLYFRTPIWDGGLFVHRLAFFAPTTTFIHQTYAPESVVKSGLDTNWPYKFSVDTSWSSVSHTSNDPIFISRDSNTLKLWSLETGAHLRTVRLPDDPIFSTPDKFLAIPGKNHFTFMNEGHVSVFELGLSVKKLKFEGYASSICYTPDETSLAIRVREGHLYFMDLATSTQEFRTYSSFFPYQECKRSILEISPDNGYLATCTSEWSKPSKPSSHGSYHATAFIYDTSIAYYGQAHAVRTLEHSRSAPFNICHITWSKDQLHIITIIQQQHLGSHRFCYLWDVETKNYQKLDLGLQGMADFGDNGLAILALKTEIHLINCLTFEVVIAIPINIPNFVSRWIFGYHGLVMMRFHGGFVFYDVSVKSKSSHSFNTSIPLPQAYQENVFQNSVKHKLRVPDLELVDGWLVMKPNIKLIWIPFPFRGLVKYGSMDQITISDGPNNVHLVLDCKAVEKYFL